MWSLLNRLTPREHERIQHKLTLTLPKLLLPIAEFNAEARAALDSAPLSWTTWIETYSHQGPDPQEPVYDQPCYCCGKKNCVGQIGFLCGGCDRKFWNVQSNLEDLQCYECISKEIRDGDPYLALEKFANKPILDARELYEAPEQVVLGWCFWKVQRWFQKCLKLSRSKVLTARCHASVPKHSLTIEQIGPFKKQRDLDSELEKVITRVNQIYFRQYRRQNPAPPTLRKYKW